MTGGMTQAAKPRLAVTLAADCAELARLFEAPPDDSRIMMRWWWFGPCATDTELARELHAMRDAGIGGVEVAVVYPLGVDDQPQGLRNHAYLGQDFLERLRFAARTARELGLRFDVTIGSGWSYGGPYIGQDLAAACLRWDRREIAPDVRNVARPVPWDGERLLAAFIGQGSRQEMPTRWEMLELAGEDALHLSAGAGPRVLLFIFTSHTGQVVKRAALGAEGYVLDHLRRDAVERHLAANGDAILGALEPGSVTAIFCDSLEVYEANWTEGFLAAFGERQGYDLRPELPFLDVAAGERSDRVRRDVYRTMTDLYEENFMVPMRAWAERHGVLFRIQNYGQPPAALKSHRHAHLVEGEGWGWRTLAETRWASSAAHLLRLPVTSSETWTWVHSPAFRATPLDLQGEAHEHFLLGINQLIGHGWPYSPPEAGWPGWLLYAAGALGDANPWWPVMPELAAYLQRLSFLLRQGEPVAHIALYAPTEDAYASFTPGDPAYLNLWKAIRERVGPDVIPAILDAGHAYDLIDDGLLGEAEARCYKAILLPNVRYLPDATRRWLAGFAAAGGPLFAIGTQPDGLPEARLIGTEVLAEALAASIPPDMSLLPAASAIGFVHRALPDGDIYFLANTGPERLEVAARFGTDRAAAELWDPRTGATQLMTARDGRWPLTFEPYMAKVLVFRDRPSASARWHPPTTRAATREALPSGWSVEFEGLAGGREVTLPHDWSQNPATRHHSGHATYRRSITIDADHRRNGAGIWLDFGEAQPASKAALSAGTIRGKSYAALLHPPLREAATIWVNGTLAGHIWAPPYRIELTAFVSPGTNELRIDVYNTAINRLAEGGRLPDMAVLAQHYGQRARLQDLDDLEPLPSGILTVPYLVIEPAEGRAEVGQRAGR